MEKDFNVFSRNERLIANIQENVPLLQTQFEILKELKKMSVSDENFNKAITAFYTVFQFVPLLAPHLNSSEMPLFRARHNKRKNIHFSDVTDLSYNSTRPDIIGAGRFNQPKQAVFYASLPVENGEINPSLAACLETCKGLTDKDHPISLTDFTISRWKIKIPFYVINFCFDKAHLAGNSGLKIQTETYLKNIKDSLNEKASSFIFNFLTYFSEMSGARSPTKNEYYILTAMFYAMRYYYRTVIGLEIHGIIYPSAMTEKKALNIVLTSNAVDEFLTADKVAMYRFFLKGNTFHATPCSEAVNIVNGKFEISGFARIPENRYYNIECENTDGGA